MPQDAATSTDDEAFTAMLQRAEPRLRAFVAQLATGQLEVDDVLQDAMTKLWRLRHTFDPRLVNEQDAGYRWLQRAVFRTFCDHWRQRRRQPAASDELHLTEAPTSPCAFELRDELRQRLQALSDAERTILIGFHRDGLDLRELARHHAMPLNTVKSHLHRARRRLHQQRGDRP